MNVFSSFCKKHPALIAAVFFLLGLGLSKKFYLELSPLLIILLFFLGRKGSYKRTLPLLAFSCIAFFYGKGMEEKFLSKESFVKGAALFIPQEIKPVQSHFKKSYQLKGRIQSMLHEDFEVAKNIQVSFPLPSSRPPIHSHFIIYGSLEKQDSYFIFKPDPDLIWRPVKRSFSLTEWRFQVKKKLTQTIQSLFSDNKVGDLLSALTLGNLEDRMLRFDFGRLGLQHILAISGFHFGLIAFLLGTCFFKFFKKKIATILLWIFLTSYFILLGNSPSILRAYLAISLYLIGKLGCFRTNGLNILGVVLLIELLLDPSCLSHLGFQLSFLATFAILFLLPLTNSWINYLLPPRNLQRLPFLERIPHLFISFLRSALSLNLAVHLAIIPICLFYFQKFPIISLAYNLFIPTAFSLSLFLFYLSIPLFFLIPKAALFLTWINELFTKEILKLVSQSPICFDLYLQVPPFPLFFLTLFLLSLFALPFLFKTKQSKNLFPI